MLPIAQRVAFLILVAITGTVGVLGFYRVFLRIKRGRPDDEERSDRPWQRFFYAAKTALFQERTLGRRPIVSLFHAFIVYGFLFYVLLNFVDALEGYFPFRIQSSSVPGAAYNLCADILSFLVLLGTIALVLRRYMRSGRRDFAFNARTPLHAKVRQGYIKRDSAIVSAFIVFHVGSRVTGQAAKLRLEGGDRFQPFATGLSHLVPLHQARALAEFGYWGALGSVLLFLAYFPWTKHIHLFMAPVKYFFARRPSSGELPPMNLAVDATGGNEAEAQQLGANRLEDLAWPRLLDAYACIQCNRCQDVCPATATGKALSPAAMEINKRMELNALGEAGGVFSARPSPFERGVSSPVPLLEFALSPEALWACTTCGACMQACPVENEQMLDIIDIRRSQVMMEGKFPSQLQSAFRGMERTANPWGMSREQRLDWAEGLPVLTIDTNPNPDVLFWVGCAASYDPQAQRTARAFAELLNHAGVNWAVLGKRECCTGDSARRAGNEYLYTQLAEQNVATLDAVNPKLIVATCPHCMNSIGKEYRQLGGQYKVMHHTEYLERLVAEGKLRPQPSAKAITYHDPCYLGRHSGVYEAPRNLLRILGNEFVELDRKRENSFCCGAGGAQFWKEEEPGQQRISDNRFQEVERRLSSTQGAKTLAVGCPFCKSMLNSTPARADAAAIEIKDVAELLLEGVRAATGLSPAAFAPPAPSPSSINAEAPSEIQSPLAEEEPKPVVSSPPITPAELTSVPQPARKKWQPAKAAERRPSPNLESKPEKREDSTAEEKDSAGGFSPPIPPPARKPWKPKGS